MSEDQAGTVGVTVHAIINHSWEDIKASTGTTPSDVRVNLLR